jgi:hypothetical protein
MAFFLEGMFVALAVALIMLLVLAVGPELVGWMRNRPRK